MTVTRVSLLLQGVLDAKIIHEAGRALGLSDSATRELIRRAGVRAIRAIDPKFELGQTRKFLESTGAREVTEVQQ